MSAPCPLLGFIVTISPASDAIAEGLRSFAEGHGLNAEIRSAGQVIVTSEATQATDADRSVVRAWAEQYRDRAELQLSEIVDLR